ncbi:MAG TPA: ABC transporter substrate-binding protein, partial [Methanoculleus sp.]|nr:ABC transporter substrate-binding protein [Methanoculleus sp.]
VNEPRLQNLDAVREGRVYVIDADIVSRGGPRIVDALEEAAAILHGETPVPTAPKTTDAPESGGFGLIPIVSALFAVILLWRGR